MDFLPKYEDIDKASQILKDVANKTPVMTSRKLNSVISPTG
jgi:threonine dehydratase